jgi:hypothetical protein
LEDILLVLDEASDGVPAPNRTRREDPLCERANTSKSFLDAK